MLAQIEDLLVLQDRDRRIAEIDRQLAQIPTDEGRARQRLESDQRAVEEALAALRDNEVRIKKLELDIGTRKTSVTRLKQQQFETRKNEEFRALGHEIERYEEEVDRLETAELELMEEADGLRETLQSARAELAKSEHVVREDLEAIASRRERLERDRGEVATERARLAAATEEQMLHLYERLLKTKKGVAIAPVESGQCGGCHVKIIPSTLIKVQNDKEVTQCETCGRILYLV